MSNATQSSSYGKEREEQSQKAAELEQLLNGFEANNPQEALLTKELQLTDAMLKIEKLEQRVLDLEKERENQSETTRLTRQRSFQLKNLRQQSFKMQRARSFRLLSPTTRKEDKDNDDDSSSNGLDCDDDNEQEELKNASRMLKHQTPVSDNKQIQSLKAKLKAMEGERDFYAQECNNQSKVIEEIRCDIRKDDRN